MLICVACTGVQHHARYRTNRYLCQARVNYMCAARMQKVVAYIQQPIDLCTHGNLLEQPLATK